MRKKVITITTNVLFSIVGLCAIIVISSIISKVNEIRIEKQIRNELENELENVFKKECMKRRN